MPTDKENVLAKLMNVWIVHGQTGEYSDCQDWIVAVYNNEKLANKHSDLAKIEANRILKKYPNSDYTKYPKNGRPPNKYDPNMDMDYTGTEYYVLGPFPISTEFEEL